MAGLLLQLLGVFYLLDVTVSRTFLYVQKEVFDFSLKPDLDRCAKARVAFTTKSPKITYFDKEASFNELVIDVNEFQGIFSSNFTWSTATLSDYEVSQCNAGYLNYDVTEKARSWHDPESWFLSDLSAEDQPFVHAEKIPGQYDTAQFDPKANHRVLIAKQVRLGYLNSGGYSFDTDSFRDHINSIEGSLQFAYDGELAPRDLAEDLITEEATNVIIGAKSCEDNSGCVSYVLNSKVMAHVCSFVTCPPLTDLRCAETIIPNGHCCAMCAGVITFETAYTFDFKRSVEWLREAVKYVPMRMSLQKTADWEYQFVMIPKDNIFKGADMENAVVRMSGIIEAELSDISPGTIIVRYSKEPYSTHKVALGLTLFCIISLIIGATIVIVKKRTTIASWLVQERVNIRALWQDRHQQEDRIHLEMEDNVSRMSIASAAGAGFDNPSFKQLLAREREKSTMAKVYNKDDNIDPDTSVTFSNPVFQNEEIAESDEKVPIQEKTDGPREP